MGLHKLNNYFLNPDSKHYLLFRRIKRFVKFSTVGLSGIIVNSGFLYLLTEYAKLDYKHSAIFAIELSIINNFLWNSQWTWADKKTACQLSLMKRFIKFHISAFFTAFVINYGVLIFLTEYLSIHYQISNLAGIALGSSINFLFSHFWVFKHREKLTE